MLVSMDKNWPMINAIGLGGSALGNSSRFRATVVEVFKIDSGLS